VSPEGVDIHRPFSEFGLDSLETLNLMMELEDWLGRELAATIAWDYPTVDGIATHLGASKEAN
jgi:acyl carrier protein